MLEIEKILRAELIKEGENNNMYHMDTYFRTVHTVLTKIVWKWDELNEFFKLKVKPDFETYSKLVHYENKIFKNKYSHFFKECKLNSLELICIKYGASND